MRIINDRYIVEKIISNGDHISSYLVKDKINDKKYVFNIIETKLLNERIKDNILSSITWIKNLNFAGVINLYDFITIENIDGAKSEGRKFAYLTEELNEGAKKISDIKPASIDIKLNVFAQLVVIINTLILKGYVYDKLDLDNIFYLPNGDVKLGDILSIEIERINLNNDLIENILLVTEDNKEDYYKFNDLTYIFHYIFENELQKNKDENRALNRLYKKLIEKAFSDFESIIEYINLKFNKTFPKFDYSYLNRINTELPIIGREYEINKFIQKVDAVVAKNIQFSIISISGDEGSGKTKLLNHFKNIIDKKFDDNVNIIDIETLVNKSISTEENKRVVFNFLQGIWDKKQKEKYEKYIEEFFYLIVNSKEMYTEEDKNTYLIIINRITKFLSEIAKNKFTVLFLDDIESKTYIGKLFLKYLCLSQISIENFLVVITYNDNKIKNSMGIDNFIQEFKLNKDFDEYNLNYLNEHDTRKLIRNMLNTSLDLYDFSNKIYKETLGNPMYVIEIIKKLFADKVIYISEKTGKWKENLKDKEIALPKNIEEEVQRELKRVSDVSYNILKKLSMFKNPIEEELLYSLGILNKDNMREFKQLTVDDYIGERISDRGILYGMNNNLMKKIIYRNTSTKEKNIWHRQISDFLEEKIKEGYTYEDELIYQLEILEEDDKFVRLCKECGEREFKAWNNNKAIYYYNRCLESKSISNEAYIDISLILADLYYRDGNIDESINCYKSLLCIVKEKEIRAYCYARIVAIGYRVEDSSFLEKCLRECRTILDEIDYHKGEIAYLLAKAKYKNFLGEYREAIKISLYALEISKYKYMDLVGYIYICLGDSYISMNEKNKPIEYFNLAKKYFKEAYNFRGIISSDFNIGNYFFRIEEDNNEALKNLYNVQKAANKYEIKDFIVLSNVYIAEVYIYQRKYKGAFELLQEALNRTSSNSLEYYRGLACFMIAECSIELNEFHLAYRYLELGKLVIDKFSSKGVFLKYLTSVMAKYYYSISDYEKLWEIIDDNIINIGEYSNHIALRIECKQHFYNLRRCKSEEDIIKEINEIYKKSKHIKDTYFKSNLLLDFIIALEEMGYRTLAKEVYENLETIEKDNKLMLKQKYIQLILDDNKTRVPSDMEVLLNYMDDKKLLSKVYLKIGEIHELNNEFIEAIESYYKVITILNRIIKTLPIKYKLNYINSGVLLKVYNNIVNCFNNKLKTQVLVKKEVIKSLQEFDELMNDLEIDNLIKNREFLYKLKENFEESYSNEFNNIYDVLDGFKSDIISNIENLTKYICKLTLAESAIVTMQDLEGLETIIYNHRAINPRTKVEFFKSKFSTEDDGKIVKVDLNRANIADEDLLPKEMKSAIYLKVKNKIRIESKENIQGSIILYSNRHLNNINEQSLKELKTLIPLLGFLLDKYNLTLNSTIDKLTNVYNRKYFEASLADLLESSRANKKEFSIAIMDIDNFKGVNDKYGHHFGDKVLSYVAAITKETIDKNDVVGRYGGEEFVVIFPDKNQYEAFETCEKFREKIQKSSLLGNGLEVTISIGISQYPIHSNSSDNLIKMADEALYVAKNTGKNRTIIWNNEVGSSSKINDKLAGILSGNTINDYRKLSAITDIIDLIRRKTEKKDKIYEFLTRVMEISEAQESTLFLIEDKIIVDEYSRKRYKDGWHKASEINNNMILEVIESRVGTYLVNWDGEGKKNDSYWIPDWKSILIVPIIYNGFVKGILYLTVSINEKEFNHNDLNFVDTLSGIFAAII